MFALLIAPAVLAGALFFSTPPASASALHAMSISGTIDLTDDDTVNDEHCNGRALTGVKSLNHFDVTKGTVSDRNNYCDEMRVEVHVTGQTTTCMRVGGWLQWNRWDVDNTEERNANDHGTLHNFRITHKV